jgi:hypothetical protein
MTDIVKGMLDAYDNKLEPRSDLSGFNREEAMRAALQWLAANVSDEMIEAALDRPSFKHAIAAAIRAAARETVG